MNAKPDLSSLPPVVLALLGALVLVQLALQVWAIVDLVRRSQDRLTLPKWLWAVIIVFGELLGPIIYFVAGRKPAPAVDAPPSIPASDRAQDAVDSLYGSHGDGDQQ